MLFFARCSAALCESSGAAAIHPDVAPVETIPANLRNNAVNGDKATVFRHFLP
jgi:hypothetical protein